MDSKVQTDRGWAWVILVATFMDLTLAGIIYCNGIFNVVFLLEYGQSKALTASCGALQASLLNLGGIVASMMSNRLGTRKTIILGGALVSVGFLGCYFANSLLVIFIFYGFVAGLGLGIVYTPAIVILGFYFSKYRNLAYGIVTTGIGVGTMFFAPLVEYLIHTFSWKGAMLILSAVFSHYFMIGALMRPPAVSNIPDSGNSVEALKDTACCADVGSKINEPDEWVHISKPIFLRLKQIASTGDLTNKRSRELKTGSLTSLSGNKTFTRSFFDLLHAPNCHLSSTSLYLGNQNLHKSAENRDSKSDQLRSSGLEKWFVDASYISYLINLLFVGIGISCTYVHFPAYVITKGMGVELASTLISVMGFGSIIGRLGVGAITNMWPNSLTTAYVSTCVLAGVTILIGPILCWAFVGQVVFSLLFAMFGNCFIALMAPMCIHTVGLENLNLAYGTAIVICGAGYLIGPPIAGLLFDLTRSYVYTFILSGVCYIGGAFIMLSVIVFKSWRLQLSASHYLQHI